MRRVLALICALAPSAAFGDTPKPAAAPPAPVSFMKDVAPILVKNCIACHNARKAESKYNMVNFAALAKGGAQGADLTLEPGKPDESRFVELLHKDAKPRMPYKQDALPKDQVAVIEQWVTQGAKYDGTDPKEDWPALLHKLSPVVVPEVYPIAVPITAVAFSPDNTEVASAGYHEVNLWKSADASIGRRLRGLSERVYDVAYSPDGKWLATASGDPGQYGAAKLWIAEPDGGGKPVRDLVETSDSVFAVAFSPDSKLVAAAGADRAIRIWEVETGKLVSTIEDHADWVLDIAFSPDGKRLASASRDKTAKVFDVAKKESLVTFPGHAETVYTVSFSPDGKLVATGGGDSQIRFWNPDEDGKQVSNLGGFGGAVFRLLYHPDGKRLLACSADKTVRIFEGAAQKFSLAGHNDWIYALAVSRDGNTIASGSWDGEVRLWNAADGKAIKTILAAPGLKK
ncbi:MAG: repeat-containing protein [Planctomycetota bacterium]|nr:repeat-containing protein [Planctomycetota bacterium]